MHEKVWDKLTGWSFIDSTDRIVVEDYVQEAKEVAEDLDDLSGNLVSGYVNEKLEVMKEFIEGTPDPRARENYASILVGHARWKLEKLVEGLRQRSPMMAGNLPVEMQRFVSGAMALEYLVPVAWEEIKPEYEQFIGLTKTLGRSFF